MSNSLTDKPSLLPFAVFDEFGKSADDRVQDYGRQCYESGRQHAAQVQVPQWLPIESAPKDLASRLYLCRGAVVQGFVDATGVLTVKHEFGWRRMRHKPTGWMPLPPTGQSTKESECFGRHKPCERGSDGYCARCHSEAYP